MKKIIVSCCLISSLFSASIVDLNTIFKSNDLDILNNIKYTAEDKEFVNYSTNLIKDKIAAAEISGYTDGVFNSVDLSPYTESINSLMEGTLSKSLTDNIMTQDNYMNMFDSSFLNGFKLEALENVASLDFLSADQQKMLTDTILNGGSLSSISSALSSMSFSYFDNIMGEYLQWMPTSLSDAASKLADALTSTKATFACVCSSSLTSAFSDFQSHIINDNLNPIYANLNSLNSTIENNIKVLKSKTPVIVKSNTMYLGMIAEVKRYRENLKKELEQLKTESGK
jgi:hypothetical protein